MLQEEKKGLSQALTIKDRGKIIFSFSVVSGDQDETSWDTPLTLEPEGSILGKLAEASKG